MADRLTRAQRSRAMARVRRTGTAPERTVAAAFRAAGVPFAQDARGLPGTPDLVVRPIRFAVFVHGCFWHGCAAHGTVPKTRRGFWRAKIRANRVRDRRVVAALRRAGWTVRVVWEHEAAARAPTLAVEARGRLMAEANVGRPRRGFGDAGDAWRAGAAARRDGADLTGPAAGADVCT